MLRIIPIVAVLFLLAGCDKKPPVVAKAAKDPKVAAVEDRISKTTDEGKQVIEKVKGLKPIVNEQVSTKTLAETVDHFAKEMGDAYNITPIGWEAAQKKIAPPQKVARWKVAFNYFDFNKQLLTAEWEYDPDTGKVYPFEKVNAIGFYSSEGADAKKGKK